MNPWRKLILYTSIVVLPSILVGISNFAVFPDAALVATGMLLITVIVSGVFTFASNVATERIVRYCMIADTVICVILCLNLGGHWLLSREVSAAKQGVEERHAEEDRAEQRRIAEAERQLQLKKAEAEVLAKQTAAIHAERRRLAQLPPEERRSVLRASEPPKAAATIQPLDPGPVERPKTPRLTPEEVREKWWWYLTALAFAECFASILAGAILISIWEWDRNRDGIPDHLQKGREVQWPTEVGK